MLHSSPARPTLWAYLSDSEAQQVRQSGKLLQPRPAGAATPAVQTRLTQLLNSAPSSALLGTLRQRFENVRTTWPNLFALRLLDHPGSEHMNPVRIVLRKDAWIGRITNSSLSVVDLKNQLVTTEQAQASPERIAAIYVLMAPDAAPGVTCERGLRELTLGSEAMVESWSLGTQEILTQIDTDITALTALFDVARPCGSVDRGTGQTFQAFTVCNTWTTFAAVTEYTAYGWSLAKPTELYKPNAQNLVSLIDALDADRFEVDPFVVNPDPSSGGTLGAGGEAAGGAGAAGEGGAGGFAGAPL